MPPERQFLFVLNEKAGSGGSHVYRERIETVFARAGLLDACHFTETAYEGHAYDAAVDFSREYGERGLIYAGGGDGTMNEVAQALRGTTCAFGIIPTGTGNDFAKTVYGTKKLRLAPILDALPRPEVRPVDLIRLTFREGVDLYSQNTLRTVRPKYVRENADGSLSLHCLNVTSFGLDSVILKRAYELLDRHPSWGGSVYYLGVMRELFGRKIFPVTMSLDLTDGRHVERDGTCCLAAICNGKYYGNGFNPVPYADPSDGNMPLCYVEWMGYARFFPLIIKYLNGKHEGARDAYFFDVKKGRFATGDDRPLLGNFDGILFEAPSFEFELEPSALRFAYLHI